MVDSLAWPASAVVIVALLRRQLAALLQSPLSRLRAGPVELEWVREAEKVGENVAALNVLPAATMEDPETDRLAELADSAPVIAVLQGFALVERELRAIAELAGSLGPVVPPGRRTGTPVGSLADILARHELISEETAAAVRGLSTLRNLAAHDTGSGTSVTVERAREYIALVEAVLFALDRATAKP